MAAHDSDESRSASDPSDLPLCLEGDSSSNMARPTKGLDSDHTCRLVDDHRS